MPSILAETREHVRIAAEALRRYTLRTSLSILGVVLGVAAVIAMMSVSDGARREALTQVEALGLDNLVARTPVGRLATEAPATYRTPPALAAVDAQRVLALVPLAASASALVERVLRVSHADRSGLVRVLAVDPAYASILRLQLDGGRFLSTVDARSRARVCVLGAALRRRLFAYRNAVGEHMRIGAEYYEVVGVLQERGADPRAQTPLAWRDVNDAAFVPLVDARADEIWLKVSDGSRAAQLAPVFQHTLSRLHAGASFDVIVPRELLAQRYRTQQTFSVVVGSVAALALLIGGIGIMNIMLTSVLERTREIGLRRTVGARRRDITLQFLTEALLMTLGGGAAGIALGAAVSAGITAYAGWATRVSATSVLLAFGVSFAVGVGFGLYPAIKAARLEPVDAVRYE